MQEYDFDKIIKELKRKRDDLSTFLVHLTRDIGDGNSPKQNLINIINNKIIEARNSKGMFYQSDFSEFVKSVCFTEAPLQQIKHMIGKLEGRDIQLDQYGIVFNKKYMQKRGANPVFYINTYKDNTLKNAICHIISGCINNQELDNDIKTLLPYIDSFGKTKIEGSFYDFHWEREWRYLGDFEFEKENIVVGLCKDADIDELEGEFDNQIKFISPFMSHEDIIEHLIELKK